MRKIRLASLALTISCLFFSNAVKGSESLTDDGLIVFEGATLIDGTGAEPIENAVVVVKGSLIQRIGQKGDFDYPDSANVHKLDGRFIIPGLIDVHTHIQTPIHEETMKMLLAYGITSIRIPGGTNVGVKVRDQIENGELIGPSVFTGGRLIDGKGSDNFVAETEDDVRQEVRRQHEEGVNLVKVYARLPPPLVAAAVDEAHRLDMPVIGHLSKTTWTEAAESGIDGLLHFGFEGPLTELISQENREKQAERHGISVEEFERDYRGWKFIFSMREPDPVLTGQRIRDLIDIDGPAVDRLIQTLLENNVMVDPTLVTDESLVYADEVERVLARLDPHKAPKSITHFLWGDDWETGNRIVQGSMRDTVLSFKPLFELGKELTLRFHKAGILLGAGSDVGMPWMTPGASLHRELELLVDTGISPMDTLQIATQNGSKFIYRADQVGTIEPGKMADMVILTANPMDDIRNTRAINTVVKSGAIYAPENLLKNLGGESRTAPEHH